MGRSASNFFCDVPFCPGIKIKKSDLSYDHFLKPYVKKCGANIIPKSYRQCQDGADKKNFIKIGAKMTNFDPWAKWDIAKKI